ncbi:MAG: PilZ domain-containing protein [Acidobacteriia bacterium]|nr:PilZ domain-containing protein [Terriglobia bacterium]
MKNDQARAENRIDAGETGQATILGHPDVTVTCHIRNFSRSGMCITVDQVIPIGKIVKVQWDDHFLVGRVQGVSPVGGAFRVGLELLYCSKWNEPMTYLLASAEAHA